MDEELDLLAHEIGDSGVLTITAECYPCSGDCTGCDCVDCPGDCTECGCLLCTACEEEQ